MIDVIYFIAAYGICFGLVNDKVSVVPFLRRFGFLDQMFDCAFCTGFHCGWFVWILRGFIEGFPTDKVTLCSQVLIWGFANAASCYMLDAVIKWVEASVSQEIDCLTESQIDLNAGKCTDIGTVS